MYRLLTGCTLNILLVATLLMVSACTTTTSNPQPRAADQTVHAPSGAAVTAIRAVLDQQVTAWNRGDIDGFMQTYWPSDDLTFSGGGQTRRGWATVRDRYKARYPTPERMGKLAFSDLEIRPLGD